MVVWLDGVAIAPGRVRGRVVLAPEQVPVDWGDLVWVGPDLPTVPRGPLWAGFVLSRAVPNLPRPPGGTGPIVGGLDADLFAAGELVNVDGSAGRVEVPDVTEIHVVTAFLQRDDGRVLLLRRSERVGSFQGLWASVSGFLEALSPESQARQEIVEETGLGETNVRLARVGRPIYARDRDRVLTVHPFRFQALSTNVRLDWEHTAFDWVDPAEILRRPTVPKLDRAWAAVRD